MISKRCTALLYVSFLASLVLFQIGAGDEDLKPVPEESKVGFESITEADAINLLTFLSADELEGRDTPSRGLAISRHYIESLYKMWGIEPAGDEEMGKRIYEQTIPVVTTEQGEKTALEIRRGGSTRIFEPGNDFFLGRGGGSPGSVEAPVVFVGYGISAPEFNYDDLAGVDLKGKIAMVMSGVPGADNKDSPFSKPDVRRKYSRFMGSYDVEEELRGRGAAAVVSVRMPDDERRMRAFRRESTGPYKQGAEISPPSRRVSAPALTALSESLPSFSISPAVADIALADKGAGIQELKGKIDSDLRPASMDLGVTMKVTIDVEQTPGRTANLLGVIEGSDPELKNEVIVIGAHLDHLGITDDGYVFNGADDNASGSVGVLELAQAFALNPVNPKRTILFAHWTGEEKGLIGSRYFVEFPTITERQNIVACLNMDMIARDWSVDMLDRMRRRYGGETGMGDIQISEKTIENLITVSLSAQSAELNRIITEKNKDYVGLLCLARASDRLSGGSDHAPFHQKNIPAAFFFAAMHADYHQPSDTVEKVNGKKMEKVIRLVYLVAWEIANSPERLEWKETTD